MSQLSHAQFPLRRHPDLLVDHRRARSAAVAEPRGANDESRDRLRWPASFRNGGRDQIGTVADVKSESLAGIRRNSQRSPLPTKAARCDGSLVSRNRLIAIQWRLMSLAASWGAVTPRVCHASPSKSKRD